MATRCTDTDMALDFRDCSLELLYVAMPESSQTAASKSLSFKGTRFRILTSITHITTTTGPSVETNFRNIVG
jgi:hypothetical protein